LDELAKSPHSSKSEKEALGGSDAIPAVVFRGPEVGGAAKSPNRSATALEPPLITGPAEDRLPDETEGGMRVDDPVDEPGGGGSIPPIALFALGLPVAAAGAVFGAADLLGMLIRIV